MTNDDERMDRAKRIREMREGSREGDSDEEAADDGDPEPPESDEVEADADDEADDTAEEDEVEEETTTEDDESAEKQTMEDLVESAAAEADDGDAEEMALDDDFDIEDELDEMEEPAAEAEAVAQVDEAVSAASAVNEPDEHTEMTETDEPTAEEEPQAESEDEGVTAPLPDTETLEDALDEGDDPETETPEGDEEMPAAPGTETETEAQEEETRVLEFRLDDEYYCLDIAYIEEIVKEETITRVPNTPEFVQGVVDLRGQITTILNPKVTLGKENTEADQLIVVFDAEAFEDQGHIGWVVDDVRQVSPITDSEVNDPPVEDDHINGVIDREGDDQFVIWTSPDLALEEADG